MGDSTALSSLLPNPIIPKNNPFTKPKPKSQSLSFHPPSIKCSNSNFKINPSSLSHSTTITHQPTTTPTQRRLRLLVSEFQSLPEPIDRVKRLLHYSTCLPPLPDFLRIPSNRVMGCTAQVWLSASLSPGPSVRFHADSDSEITRGFCACLISVLDGVAPEEVMALRPEDFGDLSVVGANGKTRSRVNTWYNVLVGMQKRTKMLVAAQEGRAAGDPFPSLVISHGGLEARGSYAEAQKLLPYLQLIPPWPLPHSPSQLMATKFSAIIMCQRRFTLPRKKHIKVKSYMDVINTLTTVGFLSQRMLTMKTLKKVGYKLS